MLTYHPTSSNSLNLYTPQLPNLLPMIYMAVNPVSVLTNTPFTNKFIIFSYNYIYLTTTKLETFFEF